MALDPRPHIEKLRAQGMPAEAILQRMTLAGWSREALVPHLYESMGQAGSSAVRAAQRHSGLFLFIALSVVFTAAGIAGVYYFRAPAVYSISLNDINASSTPLVYGAWPALADAQLYDDVKQSFIQKGASFISADLAAMNLTVYQDGIAVLSVPIAAKGKVGSWWETPVGLYEIQSREDDHFSSFGKVHQPWSLAFQGNFFIHGWPYYDGGTPVASSYSGGCIRLSNDDAKKVYDLAKTGMPVLVYNQPPKTSSFAYEYKTPELKATAFVAADIVDGTVLASKNAQIQLPLASVTKLMSALITVEFLNLETMVVVPRAAIVPTTKARLVVGKSYSVHDLLMLMLTESSNEAAEALASAVGKPRFLELMNKKARSIGLQHTTFIDPSGLEVGNSSTAEDMFALAKYIYENRRFIFNITSGALQNDAYGQVVFGTLQNFNKIPGLKNEFLGGKVGQTSAAKETYVGVFGLRVGTTTRPIVTVVLGAVDSQDSVRQLMDYLSDFYVAAQ